MPGAPFLAPFARSGDFESYTGFMRLHIGAQDGVDAGLVSAPAAKPAQQFGVEARGQRSLRDRMPIDDLLKVRHRTRPHEGLARDHCDLVSNHRFNTRAA
jgi:hypothetical protein